MRIDGSPISAPAPSPARPSPTAPQSQPKPLLSPEEEAYFTELARLGPLGYGPGASNRSGPPPSLGQRVDVRA